MLALYNYATEILVSPSRENPSQGTLSIPGLGSFQCALGRAGCIDAQNKREGDGCTPKGEYLLRKLWYRADRLDSPPQTGIPVQQIAQDDIWIDAADHALYNRATKAAAIQPGVSHEEMCRQDHVYDIVVEIGCNDDPPIAGQGSAIFMHLAREGYPPTAGCIALALPDMIRVVSCIGPETFLKIS